MPTPRTAYTHEFDMIVFGNTLEYNGYVIRVIPDDTQRRLFELLAPNGNRITAGQFLADMMDDIEAIAPFDDWSLV